MAFYSDALASRRGPLGKVWLAAHMERKLSKSQALQTDIEESIEAIVDGKVEVLALRLSGQLLLGVVRIYSRKAKYLLDDCNEALLKIKLAFRPGVVDLTEEQLTVNKTAITLQTTGLGLDMLLPDVDWDIDFEDRPAQRHGQHQAHIEDITLRNTDDFGTFDAADPFDLPAEGDASHDFDAVDLGIHWGDEGAHDADKSDRMSVAESVGVARRASHALDDLGIDMSRVADDMDLFSHKSFSRGPSEAPMDVDTFAEVDLAGLGIGFEDMSMDPLGDDLREKTPGQTRTSSRASSPLSEVPPTPPADVNAMDVEVVVDQEATPVKPKRKPKDKKQIIDDVTEIQANGANGRGRGFAAGNPLNTDVSSIITEQIFLPRSSLVMRLMEIQNDPLAHFLPVQNTPRGQLFYAAPPGLNAELAELFVRPLSSGHGKRKADTPALPVSKRARAEEEVEQGRRMESIPPDLGVGDDSAFLDPLSAGPIPAEVDQSGFADEFEFNLGDTEVDVGLGKDKRAQSVLTDRSRMSTPALMDGEQSYMDLDCPIAIFDSRHASQLEPSQTQTQTQEPAAEHDKSGYSKNTVRALALIKKELTPEDADEEPEKVLSFNKLAHKATRRAAASFFFELLVLGTRDCLQVKQARPFENIEFSAKPRLWEHQEEGVSTD